MTDLDQEREHLDYLIKNGLHTDDAVHALIATAKAEAMNERLAPQVALGSCITVVEHHRLVAAAKAEAVVSSLTWPICSEHSNAVAECVSAECVWCAAKVEGRKELMEEASTPGRDEIIRKAKAEQREADARIADAEEDVRKGMAGTTGDSTGGAVSRMAFTFAALACHTIAAAIRKGGNK